MHDDVISLSIDVEIVLGPIRSNLSRRIDHHVPIRKLEFTLVLLFGAAVDNLPTRRRLDRKSDRIRFVIHDVHKDAAAIDVRVARVELRKSPGKIVTEHFVAEHQRHPGVSVLLQVDAPCLIVDASYLRVSRGAVEACGTCFTCFDLLHVLREIENCIAPRRPLGHLKIERSQVRVDR